MVIYWVINMDLKNRPRRRMNVQLWTAFILSMGGLILLFTGFWVAPMGEIHNSVLVAFGEVCTFSGGLFGVDYTYKYKKYYSKKDENNKGTVE